MSNNNFRFPEVTGEIHSYLLMGYTGGQQLCGDFGYAPIPSCGAFALLFSEFDILSSRDCHSFHAPYFESLETYKALVN